ncbi:MAG: MCE family protein, partial [Rhodospirillales bacterium]|nr:MCE family protein [Rhodospirillales bacterium]
FQLYESHQQAEAAAYNTQIQVVSYITSDVSGLTPGAPVDALGIQVGDVTSVELIVNPATGKAKVRVTMQLQPERISALNINAKSADFVTMFQRFVNNGMRVEIGTANYVTGQKEIDLVSTPDPEPKKVTVEGGAIVLPFKESGFDNVLSNVADISKKLDQVPFQKIGSNLNELLKTANGTLGSVQTHQLILQLSDALETTNQTLKDLQAGFGQDSNFQRNFNQLINQANTTLQSLQALTTYINQHPQSVIFGRSNP